MAVFPAYRVDVQAYASGCAEAGRGWRWKCARYREVALSYCGDGGIVDARGLSLAEDCIMGHGLTQAVVRAGEALWVFVGNDGGADDGAITVGRIIRVYRHNILDVLACGGKVARNGDGGGVVYSGCASGRTGSSRGGCRDALAIMKRPDGP